MWTIDCINVIGIFFFILLEWKYRSTAKCSTHTLFSLFHYLFLFFLQKRNRSKKRWRRVAERELQLKRNALCQKNNFICIKSTISVNLHKWNKSDRHSYRLNAFHLKQTHTRTFCIVECIYIYITASNRISTTVIIGISFQQ